MKRNLIIFVLAASASSSSFALANEEQLSMKTALQCRTSTSQESLRIREADFNWFGESESPPPQLEIPGRAPLYAGRTSTGTDSTGKIVVSIPFSERIGFQRTLLDPVGELKIQLGAGEESGAGRLELHAPIKGLSNSTDLGTCLILAPSVIFDVMAEGSVSSKIAIDAQIGKLLERTKTVSELTSVLLPLLAQWPAQSPNGEHQGIYLSEPYAAALTILSLFREHRDALKDNDSYSLLRGRLKRLSSAPGLTSEQSASLEAAVLQAKGE